MAYTKYSLTPADNNAAPPNGAPEGMLPSAVNDTMRDMMAQIRDVGDGIRGGTYTMTAPVITGGSITGVALSGNTLTNPVITGGSINNTPIGASTANTGAFTTLSASSTVSGTGFSTYLASPPAIGGTAAAAGNFTTLGATGVATFSAGTVSAPAITTTGDTNTGIYFPAADTIAFTEGGTEAMRISSTGTVGIGTNNPIQRLQVTGNIGLNTGVAAGGNGFGVAIYASDFPRLTLRNSTTGDTDADGLQVYMVGNDVTYNLIESGYQAWFTNNAERMRITSAGDVGIGTNVPLSFLGKLTVAGNIALATGGKEYFWDSSNSSGSYIQNAGNSGNSALTFGKYGAGGDTEQMRITTAGNVGIGTSSPTQRLEILAANRATDTTGQFFIRTSDSYAANVGGQLTLGGAYNATPSSYAFAGIAGRKEDSSTNVAGYLQLSTTTSAGALTERMRIDSSGNVGIGVTPTNVASYKNLEVRGSTGGLIYSSNSDGSVKGYFGNTNSAVFLNAITSHPLLFGTADTERMRIDSSGNLLVGLTSGASYKLDVSSNGTTTARINRSTNTGNLIDFANGAGVLGNISTNGFTIAYNVSSDYRLKENIAPMTGALATVSALKPVTYDWKAGSSSQGFIAHELAEVFPDAVTGEKDAVDAEGNPVYQGIDTSFLVATLTAAIQEQQTLINNLTTRLNALEGK
jgi:hypothetical protein